MVVSSVLKKIAFGILKLFRDTSNMKSKTTELYVLLVAHSVGRLGAAARVRALLLVTGAERGRRGARRRRRPTPRHDDALVVQLARLLGGRVALVHAHGKVAARLVARVAGVDAAARRGAFGPATRSGAGES